MAGNELTTRLAQEAGVTESQYYNTIMKTVMPSSANVTPEHVLAFLQVAAHYDLNPLTREIYAFPAKGGGIQPVVSIDGWMKLANNSPQFDGIEHLDVINEHGELLAITCRVYRKDRQHPIEATEYMAECKRDTEPWKKWPRRMLRHKATIQALRYAFGFSGIVDQDEAERFHEADATVIDGDQVAHASAVRASNLRSQIAAAKSVEGASESATPPVADAQADASSIIDTYFSEPTAG